MSDSIRISKPNVEEKGGKGKIVFQKKVQEKKIRTKSLSILSMRSFDFQRKNSNCSFVV